MGVDWKNDGYKFDGVDASNEILSTDKISVNQDQMRFIYGVGWNAVVMSRYKLVFSYYNTVQFPKTKYLFDLWYDPDELVNHYHNSTCKEEVKKIEEELHNHYRVQNISNHLILVALISQNISLSSDNLQLVIVYFAPNARIYQ